MESKDSNTITPAPKHNADEEIRQIAYYLWLDEGCFDGRHHEHWFKAEEIWHAQQTAAAPGNAKPVRARKQAPTNQQASKTTRRRPQARPVT